MARTVFESLAWLFAPADDPDGCALVEVGDHWRPRVPRDHPSVVLGRLPARQAPLRALVSMTAAREAGLLAARSGLGDLRYWDGWRLPPVSHRPGWRGTLRSRLASGAVVRLGRGPASRRVADALAEGAGHAGPEIRLRASGDGSVMARLTRAGQAPALLRLATVGGLKDAARNSDALRRLGDAGVRHVPRLLGAGASLGVGWSVEEELQGSLVRAPSPELLHEVATWASSLPQAGGFASAIEERVELIMRAFPRSATDLRRGLDRVRERARDVPGILEHGDLWAGNLLALDGRLTGVVDWDNWHAAGVPGSDLLHVVAMTRRSRTHLEPGEIWLERPWADSAFRDLTTGYWQRIGVRPTEDITWLAGVNWWAAHVAAGLRRGRQPARDPEWVARNVENVAPRLADMR